MIERVVHILRKTTSEEQVMMEDQLTSMAFDPEIQSELRQIDKNFSLTESDGLGRV